MPKPSGGRLGPATGPFLLLLVSNYPFSRYSSGTSSSGTSWVCTSFSSASCASSTPATAPASKTFPSASNSSTLSESACSARDKPSKSAADSIPAEVRPLPRNSCLTSRAVLTAGGFLRLFLRFEAVFFTATVCVGRFFFAGFLLPARFLCAGWLTDFRAGRLDFVGLRVLFLFLEGMTAVYHQCCGAFA